jgi:hypothetical protein
VRVNCHESCQEYLVTMFSVRVNPGELARSKCSCEWRTGENSQTTKFSFTHVSELLLVLRARTWRWLDQLFVNMLE